MARARHEQNWRQWVRDLRRRQRTLDDELPRAVKLARQRGTSWAEIGRELDLSQQAAWKRYHYLDDEIANDG